MKKASILIVEDERIVAEDIASCLAGSGFKVAGIAASGEEALEKAALQRPDLVCMDIILAGRLDGIQTAKILGDQYDIPVIFLTAFADSDTLEKAKITGPYSYIVKPFDEKDLPRTLEIALYKHRLQLELRESREKYRLLVENSLLGVLIYQDHRLVFSNEVLCRLLGYSCQNLIRRNLRELKTLVHQEDAAELCLKIHQCLGEHKSFSSHAVRIRRRTRELRWMELNINQILYNKEPAVHVTLLDATDKKLMTEQLDHTQRMEIIGQLSAGMAHQVNTPLAVMSSRLQLLRSDLEQEGRARQVDDLNRVLESVDRISRFIKGLLNFSRQTIDKKETTDINHLLKEILLFLEVNALERKITILTEFTGNLTGIDVISSKLEQVFLNVIINAFDAMNQGGTLRISTGTRSVDKKAYIRITFQDSGTGMTLHTIKNIFHPFFTTKPVGKGTGLGMYISSNIVSEHNGFIKVRSTPGKGSTIEILLPRTN